MSSMLHCLPWGLLKLSKKSLLMTTIQSLGTPISAWASTLVSSASRPAVSCRNWYLNLIVARPSSGPVVTNVIGSLNPRYGLFGDTGKSLFDSQIAARLAHFVRAIH
jgi:hypothetical protein